MITAREEFTVFETQTKLNERVRVSTQLLIQEEKNFKLNHVNTKTPANIFQSDL